MCLNILTTEQSHEDLNVVLVRTFPLHVTKGQRCYLMIRISAASSRQSNGFQDGSGGQKNRVLAFCLLCRVFLKDLLNIPTPLEIGHPNDLAQNISISISLSFSLSLSLSLTLSLTLKTVPPLSLILASLESPWPQDMNM